jgi:hypothetical protein
VWFHKRWRTKPDGAVVRSKRYVEELREERKRGAR